MTFANFPINLAANYLFDGSELIKNSFVAVDNASAITYIGKKNEALIERPRMIFYNGIISPNFTIAKKDLISQRNALSQLIKISIEDPNLPFVELLKLYTSGSASINENFGTGKLEQGKTTGIILLQNVDLINLRLKIDTFVKILI
ncbi:hypothetical protein LJC11_00595 [Bacteroidales bacterium OttesenSCG-928-I21]|nr:hypothetical protein [Bacteroidales bacterium OttesenSCG-928-I21]